jgi:nucleoside-diphosphate-sugar epimerase
MKDQRPVLVLGATGQVGRCLLARLAQQERPVIAVCRRPQPSISPTAEWISADLSQPLDLAARRTGVVIHATGAWLLPAQLGWLRQASQTRLICFSSTSLLVKSASPSAGEREIAARLAAAEAALEATDISWTILRPALVYGLGLDQNISAAARFIRRWHFFPLGGPGGGLRQPVHADDLALAALTALDLEESARRTFNLGGGETLSYRRMIERLFEALRIPPRFLTLPLLARMPGRIGALAQRMESDLAFDDGEFWSLTGMRPRPFLSGGRGDLGAA